MRIYLRLALKWEWLKPGQYQHAAAMVTEMGRLLGGWQTIVLQAICGPCVTHGPLAMRGRTDGACVARGRLQQ